VTVAFDTLTYARRLREVGVPQEQAEAHAEALAAAVTETLATKEDLRELASTAKQDLSEVAASVRQEIRESALGIRQEMRELELRLTVRLGGMIGVSVAAVAALVRQI
jgi:hypothetical protein